MVKEGCLVGIAGVFDYEILCEGVSVDRAWWAMTLATACVVSLVGVGLHEYTRRQLVESVDHVALVLRPSSVKPPRGQQPWNPILSECCFVRQWWYMV